MPAPNTPLLPLIVQSVMVSVTSNCRKHRAIRGGIAADGGVGQRSVRLVGVVNAATPVGGIVADGVESETISEPAL